MLNRSTVNESFNPYGKGTATFQSTIYYMSQTLTLWYFHRSHLCYKSIINYDLDITNPPLNEQIWPVPNNFIKSRFHCILYLLASLLKSYWGILVLGYFLYRPYYTQSSKGLGPLFPSTTLKLS